MQEKTRKDTHTALLQMHKISQGRSMGSAYASSMLLDQPNHIIDHILDTNESSVKSLSTPEICTFIYIIKV